MVARKWRPRWQIVMTLTLAAMSKQAPLRGRQQLLVADALLALTTTPPRRRGSAFVFSGSLPLPQSRAVADRSATLARRGLLTQRAGLQFAARIFPSCLSSREFRPAFFCRREYGIVAAMRMEAAGQRDASAETSHFFASLTPNRPSGMSTTCRGACANHGVAFDVKDVAVACMCNFDILLSWHGMSFRKPHRELEA